jgi:integrase
LDWINELTSLLIRVWAVRTSRQAETARRLAVETWLQRNGVITATQNQKVLPVGTPVYLPLPEFVLGALDQTPVVSERYFFWSGNGKLKSAVADWQRILAKVYKTAGVPDAHAHRFRDTFAVELLLSGVPLERVSVLLDHSSVRLLRSTTRHGYESGRSKWRRTSGGPGRPIRS